MLYQDNMVYEEHTVAMGLVAPVSSGKANFPRTKALIPQGPTLPSLLLCKDTELAFPLSFYEHLWESHGLSWLYR